MDSLNLLAEATNHPLAGVGHRSSSYHQPSAPFHPSYPPTNQQYHHHQQQQSYAGSPESQNSPHGQASTSSATTGKKKSRKSSAIAGNEEEGEGQDEGARKKSKQSLSCGECKVCLLFHAVLLFSLFWADLFLVHRGGRSRFVLSLLTSIDFTHPLSRSATARFPVRRASSEEQQILAIGRFVLFFRLSYSTLLTPFVPQDAKIEPEKQPFALVDDVTEMRERLGLIERFLNTLPPPLKASMRELGIKSFGQHPKNDIKQEQIVRLVSHSP
jgi:hypothetical protein